MTDLDLFKSEWKLTRGLTLELLDSLTDAELAEAPGPDVGPSGSNFATSAVFRSVTKKL